MANDRLSQLLGVLLEADVEFVIIGGLAGVLHGAPVTTADIDIVHNKSDANVDRLLALLRAVNARMRADPRNIAPSRAHLQGSGHVLLDTDLGPLDVLCQVGVGQDYAWLLPRSEVLARGGRTLRIVDLPTLIELKLAANRAKDRLVIPLLVATLEERQAKR